MRYWGQTTGDTVIYQSYPTSNGCQKQNVSMAHFFTATRTLRKLFALLSQSPGWVGWKKKTLLTYIDHVRIRSEESHSQVSRVDH
jgi:hypothetical protein